MGWRDHISSDLHWSGKNWLHESGLVNWPWESSCCHAPPWRRGERYPWRCTSCGHRFPWKATLTAVSVEYKPRQTRSRPPWQWPGELIDRREARRVR